MTAATRVAQSTPPRQAAGKTKTSRPAPRQKKPKVLPPPQAPSRAVEPRPLRPGHEPFPPVDHSLHLLAEDGCPGCADSLFPTCAVCDADTALASPWDDPKSAHRVTYCLACYALVLSFRLDGGKVSA